MHDIRTRWFLVVGALYGGVSVGCSDPISQPRVFDEGQPEAYTNSGWYDTMSSTDVDGSQPPDAENDATDTASTVDAADTEGPEVSDNSGWYMDVVDPPDVTTETQDSSSQPLNDATEAAVSPTHKAGLDWVALAWCAPEPTIRRKRHRAGHAQALVVVRRPT